MENTSIVLFLCLFIVGATEINHKNSDKFIHPGLLHTTADLQRMKAMVAAKKQPWYAAFQSFAADNHSELSYTMQGPDAVVTREANPAKINNATGHLAHDSIAALQLALMYSITGNDSYAVLATRILEEWADTLLVINGIFSSNSQ
jgi:hypothetical protein